MNIQTTFEFCGHLYTAPPYQHHSETSRTAAREISLKADALRKRVYDYLANRIDGATDTEIQNDLHMPGDTERPRRVELVNMGLIIKAGKRIPAGKHREATIWRIKT